MPCESNSKIAGKEAMKNIKWLTFCYSLLMQVLIFFKPVNSISIDLHWRRTLVHLFFIHQKNYQLSIIQLSINPFRRPDNVQHVNHD